MSDLLQFLLLDSSGLGATFSCDCFSEAEDNEAMTSKSRDANGHSLGRNTTPWQQSLGTRE